MEGKTGQSADLVKELVITPVLLDHILATPGQPDDLSIVDIGCGDATSTELIINGIGEAGRHVVNLGLVDADVVVFNDVLDSVLTEQLTAVNVQIVQARKRDVMEEFLSHYANSYDAAVSQLVSHQILSDQEYSYLMYLTYQMLRPDGAFYLVNLHPKYIEYLGVSEPDKFRVISEDNSVVRGVYNFDSSGSVDIRSRPIEMQLASLLELGFDLVRFREISPGPIADKKARYGELTERQIPMFYLFELKKNSGHTVDTKEGLVVSIDDRKIHLINDEGENAIPLISDFDPICVGDYFIAHDAHRNDVNRTFRNFWIIGGDGCSHGGRIELEEKLSDC